MPAIGDNAGIDRGHGPLLLLYIDGLAPLLYLCLRT